MRKFKIPLGGIQKIAKRVGVHRNTVSLYLRDESKSNPRIEKTINEFMSEYARIKDDPRTITIPRGYKKVIAARAGVSQRSVSSYFNGKTKSSDRINKAIRSVLNELNPNPKRGVPIAKAFAEFMLERHETTARLRTVKIPQGYKKVIAARAGVTQKTISLYLKGKLNTNDRINAAIIAVLKELKMNESLK